MMQQHACGPHWQRLCCSIDERLGCCWHHRSELYLDRFFRCPSRSFCDVDHKLDDRNAPVRCVYIQVNSNILFTASQLQMKVLLSSECAGPTVISRERCPGMSATYHSTEHFLPTQQAARLLPDLRQLWWTYRNPSSAEWALSRVWCQMHVAGLHPRHRHSSDPLKCTPAFNLSSTVVLNFYESNLVGDNLHVPARC